ncbi:hypothetical protein [Lysobacter enzymogenes]|uniref:Uncharacterized protein n=1 Tax=Lysobacter enzymogenes TaxID=69 RepID=A0A0S2DNX3_LYSEN|nr:hypothetical protein [Lysobacter enzymogenes]ALN59848.1 hypothetical protein GLE_4507 [Lysobacter enzymogenes]QCW27920.1 hypothetical protein FE772_22015 [Lysobacter enzymogenes]QQQ02119.1 hypothetical protein JHW41_03765 [Lysobacter enzymogenes]UZW61398.1 hypothetical protein BV903_003600 [Lysobacter enzymogenes]
MNQIGSFALFAMFWLVCGALLFAEGKPPLAILAGLVFMTLPYFASKWVQDRHAARAAAARKTAGRASGLAGSLVRDIGIAALAGAACLGLALWALLGF